MSRSTSSTHLGLINVIYVGVKNLFDAIIKEIIKRKDVLERDRIAKDRDSIVRNYSNCPDLY